MNRQSSERDPVNPFDSDDWRNPSQPSGKFSRLDSVTVGTPLRAEETLDLMGEEIRRLQERVTGLERAAILKEKRTAELFAQITQLMLNYTGAPSTQPNPASFDNNLNEAQPQLSPPSPEQPASDVDTQLNQFATPETEASPPAESPISQMRGLRRGFDDSGIHVFRTPSGEHKPFKSSDVVETPKAPESNETPPDVSPPDPNEKDWNVWLEAWVLAEQRAALLGEQNVPQISALIFTPGGGQSLIDTFRSLNAGRDMLVEAHGAAISDEQIKSLIQTTLAKYDRELDALRKQSPWQATYGKLLDGLKALGTIAQGEILDALIRAEDKVEDWRQEMDASADWFVEGKGYSESIALKLAKIYDQLCDRPGSRQSQFSIENQADMITYNSLRAVELFLAKMNVQRDKELVIGKQYDQIANPKLRDLFVQKKATPTVPAKPIQTQKVSRILRNRWVLMTTGNREASELVKASYELE